MLMQKYQASQSVCSVIHLCAVYIQPLGEGQFLFPSSPLHNPFVGMRRSEWSMTWRSKKAFYISQQDLKHPVTRHVSAMTFLDVDSCVEVDSIVASTLTPSHNSLEYTWSAHCVMSRILTCTTYSGNNQLLSIDWDRNIHVWKQLYVISAEHTSNTGV